MMGLGTPAGVITPGQLPDTKPGTVSLSVGTSGSCGRRFGLPVAMARSLPAWMCCSATWTGRNMKSMRPPSRSVTAPAVPLYGTCSISMPVFCASSAIER